MTRPINKTIKLLALLTILAGGTAAVGASFFTAYKSLRFYAESTPSEGTIVKMEQTSVRRNGPAGSGRGTGTSRNKTLDTPIIRYSPEKDKWVDFKSNVSFKRGQYKIGNTLPIRYVPGEPQRARINTERALWHDPVFFFLFGTVFTAIGLYLYKKKLCHAGDQPPRNLATD